MKGGDERGEYTEEEKERQTLHVRKKMRGKEELAGEGRTEGGED